MSSKEKLRNKLHSALKLSGFNVRREFCGLIIEKFSHERVELNENSSFDNIVKDLCKSLESQCLSEQSIEREHIVRAIEVCLHSGYDHHETVFSVINAFDFPKLKYNPDRKMFFIDKDKSKMLADANVKAKMFLERYSTILQRTKRNFSQNITENSRNQIKLQTVDYLLTLSYVTLEHTVILGSLLQVSEGKFYLEDPTGIVELDLAHAKYHGGFFVENCFVLVNGYYEDKILHVSSVILPPGEEYKKSRPSFGSINYFGGLSNVPLKDSRRLKEHLISNQSEMIMLFSDVWLDHPLESTRETNPDNESQGTEKSAGGSEDEFSVTQNNRTINIPVKSQCASKKSGGKTKNISKEDELLQMAIGEMKRNDDEQIFGDFVASSLRNLHSDIAKRQLKRKIQISIIEMTDYDEELFQEQPSVGQPNTSSQYNISTESSTECFEFDV